MLVINKDVRLNKLYGLFYRSDAHTEATFYVFPLKYLYLPRQGKTVHVAKLLQLRKKRARQGDQIMNYEEVNPESRETKMRKTRSSNLVAGSIRFLW